MNRSDLKRLSETRLKECRILLNNRKYSGAYHLCGYTIECALKACFSKKIRKSEFPDKKAIEAIWRHDPKDLVGAAGLKLELDKKLKSNKQFEIYWAIICKWSVNSRYEFYKKRETEDLYKAISDPNDGVLEWIKKYW